MEPFGVITRELSIETVPSLAGENAPSHPRLTLEERLIRLEHIVNSAPIGLCFLDLDHRYITVNECFAGMYDLPVAYFINRTVQEVLPSVAEQIIAHLNQCFLLQRLVETEITFERASCGSDPAATLYYLRSAAPVHDLDGIIIGFSVALVDITERRRGADALRESEENFRYTVDLNPHVPWTTDAAGKTLYVSTRFLTLTGLTAEQAAERSWQDGVHPEDIDATLQAWQNALQTGVPYDCVYRILDAAGIWRWVRARAFPRRDVNEQIIRWHGILEDIHERMLLDQALQLKTARLEEVSARLALLVREDHLTGLANRRHFDDALQREAARARRSGQPLSLIMIDVDHFKRFNDTYGHPAGDECLRAVAGALGKVLRRQGDLAARYGGEEFVILLPDTGGEGAMVVAQHANAAVRDLAIAHSASSTGILSISAGVAVSEPGREGDTSVYVTDLVQSADLALYAAKERGRDRIAGAGKICSLDPPQCSVSL